jgi:predicted enzyme related to lactoylglutathione lyase
MEFIVNIDVDDLESAERFYRKVFGLRVGRRFGESAVELLGASTPLYLLEKAGGTPAVPAAIEDRRYTRHWTPVHLDFVVDDIDAAIAKAVAAGALLEQPASTHEWGKLALMADPFGHGFCFIEFMGRGYDEIAE